MTIHTTTCENVNLISNLLMEKEHMREGKGEREGAEREREGREQKEREKGGGGERYENFLVCCHPLREKEKEEKTGRNS